MNSLIYWARLNRFGSLPLLQANYLLAFIVPVVAIFVISINEITETVQSSIGDYCFLLKDSEEFKFDYLCSFLKNKEIDISLSYRYMLLFAGSFALALGTILHQMFCPIEIQRHKNRDAYRDYSLKRYMVQMHFDEFATGTNRMFIADKVEGLLQGRTEKPNELAEELVEAITSSVDEVAEQDRTEQALSEEEKWDEMQKSRALARVAVASLFLISAMIALCLLIDAARIVWLATFV